MEEKTVTKKRRGDRRDAVLCRDVGAMNALMPYLMPRRSDSLVYFDIKVDMAHAIAYVQRYNEEHPEGPKMTYMHLLLAAIVKIYRVRPHLNSYIIGGRFYRRRHILISFAVKKQLTENAPETTAKINFDDCYTLSDVVRATSAVVREAKSAEGDHDEDKIFSVVAKLPRPVLRFFFWALRRLDAADRFPRDLYAADPMHTSAFIANLGSLGLDAPFHHLYEWGNCSLFAAMGKIHKEPVADEDGTLRAADICNVTVTIDERIGEGAKFVRDLALFQKYMEQPELLEMDERKGMREDEPEGENAVACAAAKAGVE